MIIINFENGQGLGNQLWLYASCRGIAKKLNYHYKVNCIEKFKGKNFLNIDDNKFQLLNPSNNLFKEQLYYDPVLKYFASDYDFRVEEILPNTEISGVFQSEEYLYNFKDEVRNWVKLSDEMIGFSENFSDTCVLNIRGGEYKRHKKLILNREYWVNGISNILQKTGVDKFLIVTDDVRYAEKLHLNIPILKGGVAECYAALYGSACAVLSNSSFSYFPIKTRMDNPFIIAPYLWSRPYNEEHRWAAPANLYRDWFWQDKHGHLYEYNDCIPLKINTLNYYKQTYTILVPNTLIDKGIFRKYFPRSIIKLSKIILSTFFPKYFG